MNIESEIEEVKISLVGGYLGSEVIGARNRGWHRHEPGQLMYCTYGQLSVQTRSEDGTHFWYVPALQGLWVPPNCMHAVDLKKDSKVISIYINNLFANEIPGKIISFHGSNLLRELILACSKVDFAKGAIAKREERLLHCLFDQFLESKHDTINFALPKEPRLQKLLDLLLKEPEKKESITSLAKKLGMSSKSLSRLLLCELNMTFTDLRTSLRIFLACKALQKEMPIADTAYSLGYSSQATFTTQFKKYIGTTPKQYADIYLRESYAKK